jgi:hypothetical protein
MQTCLGLQLKQKIFPLWFHFGFFIDQFVTNFNHPVIYIGVGLVCHHMQHNIASLEHPVRFKFPQTIFKVLDVLICHSHFSQLTVIGSLQKFLFLHIRLNLSLIIESYFHVGGIQLRRVHIRLLYTVCVTNFLLCSVFNGHSELTGQRLLGLFVFSDTL